MIKTLIFIASGNGFLPIQYQAIITQLNTYLLSFRKEKKS